MYAGKDMPTVTLSIVDNELIVGKAERHTIYVSDLDTALQDLLKGRTVYVLQNGPLVSAIQRTVAMILRG